MEILGYLKNISIFSELKDQDLKLIYEKMILRSYSKGELIVLEETIGDKCYFIFEGSVKITRSNMDGREVILAILNVGEFFGEMSLLDGETRSANVFSQENTKVSILSRDDFLSIFTSRQRATIRKERKSISSMGIEFSPLNTTTYVL